MDVQSENDIHIEVDVDENEVDENEDEFNKDDDEFDEEDETFSLAFNSLDPFRGDMPSFQRSRSFRICFAYIII